MLGVNQSDFMSYMSALKTNYRKGIHRMEAILANPTHAAEFAANLGGVSVVLGVPIELPDRNSDKLLELLLGSTVADDAVLTWMHQFYEFTDWDDLMGNAERCKEMANNPLIWRAAGGSKLAVGKSIATLAGLSCSAYKDIDAVAASSTAMTAVAASSTAMAAVAASSTAMAAVAASSTAMTAIIANSTALNAVVTSSTAMAAIQKSPTALNAIAASSMATAKYAAGAAGLNPADYADMKAVAASSTAMAAVAASSTAMAAIVAAPVAMAALWRSDTAIKALQANATAWKTFTGASSSVMGKTVAILAGLNPSSYADMTAIAASSTAMAAVVNSTTACRAIESSATAIAAMNAASGFVEVTNQVCQANSSMSVALINKKAWVSQYWNTSSDTNTSQSMLIGVNVVGGGSTNIGNFSVARTRKSVNKFVSTIRIATTYGSALSYGGIRYKPLS